MYETIIRFIQAGFELPVKPKHDHEGWTHIWRKVKTVSGKEVVYDLTSGNVVAVYDKSKRRII
mgnify:CR=1 FL=1